MWEHDELAEDLSKWRRTCFLNVNLGAAWENLNKVPRADVVEIKPSYTRFCVSIFEVKVTRSDFLSDIRTEKWQKYLPHCHRLYFATPEGLVDKTEIPDPAGLVVRTENKWTFKKHAKPQEVTVPRETLMALLFAKTRYTEREKRRQQVQRLAWLYYKHGIGELRNKKHLCKLFGEKIAQALHLEYELAKEKERAKSRRLLAEERLDEIEELLNEIKTCLGLERKPYYATLDIRQWLERIECIRKGEV